MALLVAACVAAWFALRMVPEQLRRQTELLIGEAIGAEAKIGELHLSLRLFPWLRLEARGDRVDISAPSARVVAGSISTSLDPLALLRGRVRPHHVRISRVRVDFAGNGALWGQAEAAAPQPPELARLLEALEATAAMLRAPPSDEGSPGLLGGAALEVADFSLWLGGGEARAAVPLLRQGAAQLRFSADSQRSDLRLTGQLATRAEPTALRFDVHDEPDEISARLRLDESDLDALFEFAGNAGALHASAGKLAAQLRATLPLRGRAALALGWRVPKLGAQRFEFALDGRALRGNFGAGKISAAAEASDAAENAAPRLALNLRRPRLRLDVALAADAVELRDAEFSDGGLALRAKGRAALPFEGAAPLRASVSAGRLSRAALAHGAAQLGGTLRGHAEAALGRLASGEVRSLRLEVQSSAEGLGEIAARGPLARPGDLRLSLRFADVALQSSGGGGGGDGGSSEAARGEGDSGGNSEAARGGSGEQRGSALRSAGRGGGASGALRFDGDRLEVRGLTLPARARATGAQARDFRIDAELSGLSGLPALADLRCQRPAPVPALPGIGPLRAWQWSRRPDPYVPRWQNLHLQLDWFAHPAFLCAGRNIALTMKPVPERGRVEFAIESALWAELPLTVNGHFLEDKTHRRMQIIAALDGRAATAAQAAQTADAAPQTADAAPQTADAAAQTAGEAWARGRFELRAERMGLWHITGAQGTARAQGSTLHLENMRVDLAPGGPVELSMALELDEPRPPRYRAALSLAGTDLLHLWTAAGRERGLLSGSLHGALTLQSRLAMGQSILYGANGTVSLQARSGRIHRRLPLLLAIAGHRFNPFGDRERLPYRAIDLVGLLRGGDLRVHVLSLSAPNLRAAVQGHAQLSAPWQLEGVMGLFFFPLLDNLIDLIPLLNRVILGKNGNLVGAYFALDGTLPAPRARLVPGRSLIEGPAGSVLLSVPNFVFDGIRGIQSIVQPRKRAEESQANGEGEAGAGREES
ncbi:MAG: hypothetical protein OXU78_00540 [Deltaproteobacteria bacterium]|nr:hypothetical protein [Deltaproteobacteria bacterium]